MFWAGRCTRVPRLAGLWGAVEALNSVPVVDLGEAREGSLPASPK